jgi:hypothetical protein
MVMKCGQGMKRMLGQQNDRLSTGVLSVDVTDHWTCALNLT